MFQELNSVLQTGSDCRLSGLSVGVSETNADGTFILNHYLSGYVKQGWNVCLLNLQQSNAHYNVIGNKLSVNLAQARDNGNFIVMDGLKSISEQVVELSLGKGMCHTDKGNVDFSAPRNHSLKKLFLSIAETLSSKFSNESTTLVIIDDLSIFLTLGIPVSDVVFFMQYLHQLVRTKTNIGLLSLVHCNKEDHDVEQLAKHLEHTADLYISAQGLDTGYCKDVHGELVLHRTDGKAGQTRVHKMQYKLSDKTVTLFAPGMSTAVL